MVGKTVGKYRIVERLGRGGMGTVYRAIDETLDRDVAIKILNPDLADADLLKRFRAEALTLARLNHPGIATIYELYRQDEDLMMVMEFVHGETVQAVCGRVGPMGPPQAAHICVQVLDALAYAHRAGVVHRDLKPANLMLTGSGALKVMDFGIARVLGGEHLTHGGYMMGTPAYMSPEQVLGREIDGRADLYAVGVLFYRLLTGELPFRADTAIAMAQKQIADPPTPVRHFRPDLPAWCNDVIERALAKDPDRRFQTAEEFRAALVSSVRPEPLSEMPTQLTPTPPGTQRTLQLNGLPSTVVMRGSGEPTRAAAATAVATPPPVAAERAAPRTESASAAPITRPHERTTTTVVLGRTHLAAIGALFGLLAVGIGVLAYVALRQRASPTPSPSTTASSAQETGVGAPPPPAPPSASSPPPAAPADVPPATSGPATVPAPRVEPIASKPPAPSPSARGVATAGAAPPTTAAGRGAGAASKPSSAAPGGRSTGQSEARDPSKDVGVPAAAPSEPAPAPPTPAPPAAAPLSLDNVRLIVMESDDRGRERTSVLQMFDDHLVVGDRTGGASLTTLPYSAILSAHFSRSRQPKWRGADGKEVESRVDLGRLGFLRSERNWLILVTSGGPLILRFEDDGLQARLAAVQARMGIRIQR